MGSNPFSGLLSMDGGGSPSFSLLSSMGLQDMGGLSISDDSEDDGEYILGFAKEESSSMLQTLQRTHIFAPNISLWVSNWIGRRIYY